MEDKYSKKISKLLTKMGKTPDEIHSFINDFDSEEKPVEEDKPKVEEKTQTENGETPKTEKEEIKPTETKVEETETIEKPVEEISPVENAVKVQEMNGEKVDSTIMNEFDTKIANMQQVIDTLSKKLDKTYEILNAQGQIVNNEEYKQKLGGEDMQPIVSNPSSESQFYENQLSQKKH